MQLHPAQCVLDIVKGSDHLRVSVRCDPSNSVFTLSECVAHGLLSLVAKGKHGLSSCTTPGTLRRFTDSRTWQPLARPVAVMSTPSGRFLLSLI